MLYKVGRYVIKFLLVANAKKSSRFSVSSNLEREGNEKISNSNNLKNVVQTISTYP